MAAAAAAAAANLLEINLISAQGLKPPSSNLRRLQTYALTWVDPSTKLRTRIDRVGGENPTWNDKFFFRVTADFLSSDTSAVCVEIYAVGYLKDPLIGAVRLLLSNCFSLSATSGIGNTSPSFTAVQIRRTSGRFHGVLNIGAMVIKGLDFSSLTGMSAIGYRDLMGENRRRRNRVDRRRLPTANVEELSGAESCENSCGDSAEYSDGTDSSSSTSTSTALKTWNGRREMAGNKCLKSDVGGLLCGLGFQRKVHLSPSDQNFQGSHVSEEDSRS